MRFWISGPRMFSGLIRPGVSFGPEDWRPRRATSTDLGPVRKDFRRLAKERGMAVPDDATIDPSKTGKGLADT
jgi:hypothetical protein